MSTGSSFPGKTRQTGTTRLTGDTGGINTYKGEERALRANRLGTPGLLLSVLAASAPLMVVAGVMPTVFGVMGIVGQPLLYVILGAVLMLFSVGYAEMSRHVHNAGAFYAYIARGLGPTAGAGASLVALVAYSAMQVGIYGILGFEVSVILSTYAGIDVQWWIPALISVVVVGILGWLKIDLNAKVLGVLLVIECLLVVIFDIAAVSEPGPEGLSFAAFNPETLTGAGLSTALCFCIAAFVGFEQAPVYAEETSRPQIVVSRVMFLAVGYAALFLAISSWALTVAAGPGFIADTSLKEGPGMLFGLTEERLGSTFTDVLHILFVTGMFAALLSFHNVVARYAFAMGREGLLPARFGRTNRASGAPGIGSLLQSVISVVIVLAFAFSDDNHIGDPTVPVLRLFTWMGNRLRAELETTPPSPARPCAHSPMASSQGHRSSSSRGVPADIFSMFARGWKSSPSAYGTPSSAASRGPIVVLPVPATPITTTTWGGSWGASLSRCLLRHRSVALLKPIRYDLFK
ncbi:hypothetical protein SCYAM73S_03383 [Streptomyces cyaneofuscatus]